MKTMKAIRKRKPGGADDRWLGASFAVAPCPTIDEDGDDVLIRPVADGWCGTDGGIYQGKPYWRKRMNRLQADEVTLGHEFCGVVVGAGRRARDRWGIDEGDYVTAEMHIPCYRCPTCRNGDLHVCPHTVLQGVDADGTFAEYVRVSADRVIQLPPDLPPKVAGFCDAIGNAVHMCEVAPPAGQRVAVLGLGPLGLMGVALAKRMGAAEVLATALSDPAQGITLEVLETVRFGRARRLGADRVFDSGGVEFRTFLTDTEQEGWADVVFETTGAAYEDALRVVRPGGKVVVIGTPSTTVEIDLAARVIFRGVSILPVFGRKLYSTWEKMMGLLKDGHLVNQLAGLVTHEYTFEQLQGLGVGAAVDEILRGKAIKVVFYPSLSLL